MIWAKAGTKTAIQPVILENGLDVRFLVGLLATRRRAAKRGASKNRTKK
jgi:hypothetical protein